MRIERYRDPAILRALEEACGWARPAAESIRKIDVFPDHNFAAHDESGAIAGVVSLATYEDKLAWLGSMLVRPDARGRGLGRALVERAVAEARALGVACIGLDATEMGRPLYEKLGFRPLMRMPRWEAGPIADELPRASASIYPISSCEIMELHAYDASRFGASRAPWLASVMAAHPERAFVAFDRATGAIVGYALGAERFAGPLVADSPQIATRLLHATQRAGTPGLLFAPERPHVEAALVAAGWKAPGGFCTRMLLQGELPGKRDAIYALAAYAVG